MNYWEAKLRGHLAAHGYHESPPVSSYAELVAIHDAKHAEHDAAHAEVFATPIVVER